MDTIEYIQDEPPVAYTLREAARILRVDPRTLRKDIRAGLITKFQVGKVWLISKAEILRVMKLKGEPIDELC